MKVWGISFQIYRSMPSFPYPGRIEEEIQADPGYHCEGRNRMDKMLLFVCTLKGRGVFRKNAVEHDMVPGRAFLCRSSDNTIAWYYPDKSTIPWQFIWVNFIGNTAGAMLDDLTHRHGHVYDVPVTDPLIRKLYSFRQHQHRLYAMNPMEGAEFVYSMLGSLASKFENRFFDDPTSLLIKQAQELILERLPGDVSVGDIARQIRLSREHFSRLFRLQTGLSPADYILRQKIRHACHLLKESTLSCKEIADRLGYRNPTNFSRAFRNLTQMSPKEFRITGTMPLF